MTVNETLEQKLDRFRRLMLKKFYDRVAKHPGQSSVTDPNHDWKAENIEDIEHHLIYEFLERFPQFIDRFPEVDKSHITVDAPEIEDVDMANLSFVDWAVRDSRKE
jgi:hypothetical protein